MEINASNVLLCLRYGIGDLIMELPVIDRLREVLPHARITGLGAEPAIEIFDHDRRLDQVFSVQQWGIQHLGHATDDPIQRQFTDWFASSRFDLVLDPSHTADIVRQIIRRQDIPTRDSDPACLEIGLAQGMDGQSAVRHAAWQGWGLEVPASYVPMVRLQFEELEWAGRFLEDRGMANGLVAVAPGASDDLKRWPAACFARLCRNLVEDLGAGVLLFCGPGEARILRDLTACTGGLDRMLIVQNLHLRRVAALLSHCTLYVGNDSGLMHLAAAVQTPVTAIFGPTIPRLHLPQWIRSRAVASSVACPYRPQRTFGHPRCVLTGTCLVGTPCIEIIEPERVFAAVREEYNTSRQTGPLPAQT